MCDFQIAERNGLAFISDTMQRDNAAILHEKP
jgi:hypothetical protein